MNEDRSLFSRFLQICDLSIFPVGLLIFFNLIFYIYAFWFGAGWYRTNSGTLKSGDLYKHYGAAQFAAAGNWQDLYSRDRFHNWAMAYRKELEKEAGPPAEPHTEKTSSSNESSNKIIGRYLYVYPPLVAWVAGKFASFDYFLWPNAWFICVAAFYFVAFSIVLRTQPELKLNEPRRALYFFCMPAFYYCLWILQNSTLTLLFIFWAGTLLNRNRPVEAGIVLSALFYKPQIFIFIAVMMLCSGQIRFMIALGLASLGWLLLGVALCGLQPYLDWREIVQSKFLGNDVQIYRLGISLLTIFTYFQHTGETPQLFIQFVSIFGLSFAGILGYLTRNYPKTHFWKPSFFLYLSIALWVVLSPVPLVFCYDWLLTVPWFYVCASVFNQSWKHYALLIFYFLLSPFLDASLFFRSLPPPGSLLCPLWVAFSLMIMMRRNFPKVGFSS